MTCDLDHCLAILKALQIGEVRYWLSGGGDSGTSELEGVLYCDGRQARLPSVTIGITDRGEVVGLAERLNGFIEDIPDGDWINNEGGYGHVILRPQESDPDLQVECDMTYGEEEADPDFEDDEESLDFNESDPDADSDALTVDEGALQPAKGDRP